MSSDFAGLRTESISNRFLRVEFLAERCLRIVRVNMQGSTENVFAELADLAVTTPLGSYNFYGGHRLWCAPESYPGSFEPDDVGVSVERTDQGVRLTQASRPGVAARKSIELHVDPDRPCVRVRHRIENAGEQPLELAPWGITQVPLGGLALLPQYTPGDAENQVMPRRNLVMWPNTV